jgi:hypothetical protein
MANDTNDFNPYRREGKLSLESELRRFMLHLLSGQVPKVSEAGICDAEWDIWKAVRELDAQIEYASKTGAPQKKIEELMDITVAFANQGIGHHVSCACVGMNGEEIIANLDMLFGELKQQGVFQPAAIIDGRLVLVGRNGEVDNA